MTDDRTDFDSRLTERLRAHESRVPVAAQPLLTDSGSRWALVVGSGAAVALALAIAVYLPPMLQPTAVDPSPSPTATATVEASSPASPAVPTQTAEPTDAATPLPTPQPWREGRIAEIPGDSSPPPLFFGVQWFDEVGWMAYGLRENTEESRPGIWTSGDGLSWELAHLPSVESRFVVDVVRAQVGGSDLFVAAVAGYSGSSILVSADGRTWARADTPETPARLTAIVYGPAGFMATGVVMNLETFDSSSRIWRSSDGLSWAESTPAGFGHFDAMGLEIVGDTYVAVGFPDRSGPPLLGWSSTDGENWSREVIVPEGVVQCLCVAVASNETEVAVLGVSDHAFVAIRSEDGAWRDGLLTDESSAAPTTLVVLDDGTIIAGAHQYIADGPSTTFVWVRESASTTWRTVDWHAHRPGVPREEANPGGMLSVATNGRQTLLMLRDGTVFLTSDPLP